METKGQRTLKNIKTHWISMLFPLKTILFEYWALALKMYKDVGIVSQVACNLELFCDLEVMFGLFHIVSLPKGLNELIKLSQSDNVLYVILLLL
jgi:hypothetical protein